MDWRLHLAAWSGQTEVVRYLCQHKVDVGAAAMDDMGSIHFASQKGHLEIVRLLLSSGVSVKAANRKGFTPLHYAVQGSHQELARYLVRKGASLSVKNKAGKSPLDLATSEEVRSFLVECEESSKKNENPKEKSEAGDSAGEATVMHDKEEDDDDEMKKRKNEEAGTEVRLPEPKKARVALGHLLAGNDVEEEQ